MSRLARRRARHAAWTLGVLLLVLVALLPGATYPSGTAPVAVKPPYEKQAAEQVKRLLPPFENIEIKRIGEPPVLVKNPADLDVQVQWSVPASWGLAPSRELADGHWPDPPGWCYPRSYAVDPYQWLPEVPYRHGSPDLGPSSGGGPAVRLPPTNTLGGGSGGGGGNDDGQIEVSTQIVPEPMTAWLLAAAALVILRPGRRPRAASTSPVCPSI